MSGSAITGSLWSSAPPAPLLERFPLRWRGERKAGDSPKEIHHGDTELLNLRRTPQVCSSDYCGFAARKDSGPPWRNLLFVRAIIPFDRDAPLGRRMEHPGQFWYDSFCAGVGSLAVGMEGTV
jgi:hypothetical protein